MAGRRLALVRRPKSRVDEQPGERADEREAHLVCGGDLGAVDTAAAGDLPRELLRSAGQARLCDADDSVRSSGGGASPSWTAQRCLRTSGGKCSGGTKP